MWNAPGSGTQLCLAFLISRFLSFHFSLLLPLTTHPLPRTCIKVSFSFGFNSIDGELVARCLIDILTEQRLKLSPRNTKHVCFDGSVQVWLLPRSFQLAREAIRNDISSRQALGQSTSTSDERRRYLPNREMCVKYVWHKVQPAANTNWLRQSVKHSV